MQCAISGTTPEEPVVSIKTGHVFEKRLIEKHLKAVGTCPVTKEELHLQDLLPLKTSRAVRPRPPAATSIPGMIQMFQNEWDSLMLETFTLKQHLDTVRQELAHALYQHDAACRVIARLITERDEARAALGNTQGNMAAAMTRSGASAMEDDEEEKGITGKVVTTMNDTAKQLSTGRKKRVKGMAAVVTTKEDLATFAQKSSHPLHSAAKPGIHCLDLNSNDQDLCITGGADANAMVFNRKTGKIMHTLKGHKKAVTDVKFHPNTDVLITASEDNTACVWRKDDGKYAPVLPLRAHTAPVVGVTVHPSGQYLISASKDKSWAFWDIVTGVCREQVTDKKGAGYTRCEFHPDGLIFGTGTEDSVVRIFDVKQQKNVATFTGHNGPVNGLAFSENGYYLASGDSEGVVKLWDLRKLQNFHTITNPAVKTIGSLSFDLSGSYLAVGGSDLRVYSTKGWGEVLALKDHRDVVTGVKFSKDASFIASTGGPQDRTLKFFEK